MMQADVAIVGAGPAGLAAAAHLGLMGVKRIVVIEREPEPGGIPRHCGHSPFGLREFRRVLGGASYARRLAARAERAGATILCRTTVTALHPGPELALAGPDGVRRLAARAVLLATGTRESSRVQRMIGGAKPGGILTTGALQGLVHLNHQRPFLRPVILGTELVAFSALLTCRQAGMLPVAMIEPGERVIARAGSALLPRLTGVPVMLGTRIVEILGRDRVEGVLVDGPRGPREIEADGVVLTGAFRSEAPLMAAAGMALDPRSTGPEIDVFGRLDEPGYFAAGNLLCPVETAGHCWASGRRVADAIAAHLTGGLPDPHLGMPLRIVSESIRFAVPQRIFPAGPGAHDAIQLRVTHPVSGELQLSQGGDLIARKRLHAQPERRITLTLPQRMGRGPLELDFRERA